MAEELLEDVMLPSKGKFNPEYAGKITIDMIGYEEERIAFGSTTEEAIDEVINRCVKSPKDFDASRLTQEDRFFLLMKIRIHSYGDEYHITYEENGEEIRQKISLDDLEVIELDDNYSLPKGKLPLCGSEIEMRPIRVADYRKIEDYCREKATKFGVSYISTLSESVMLKKIASIDGEKKTTSECLAFYSSLKGKDLAYIRWLAGKVDNYGYSRDIDIVTKSGMNRKVQVRMTGEFFRPEFDD